MGRKAVRIELSPDEAPVLFEFLARFGESDRLEIADRAEVDSLRRLERALGSRLVEILEPNYDDLLARARERLREQMGD